MQGQKLRIGKIPYTNLFPIFYMLENRCDCSGNEFVEGMPSTLNQMLRMGEVDVSPSSSIEYLRFSNEYSIMDNHSITSFGPIGSIFLFSRLPVEKLGTAKVLASSQSATSTALLKIILNKFYSLQCEIITADIDIQNSLMDFSDADAFMLIGDDALRIAKTWNSQSATLKTVSPYIYDLGDLWHRHTGLSFTFALWIFRKDCSDDKQELLNSFASDLDKAKKLALGNFGMIASESPLKGILTEKELITYWENISYDFGDEHKKGLELFRKLSEELGLI